MPSSWAVAADGSLILGYDYNAIARDFVATAKIPRALFIAAVDPRTMAVCVKDPRWEAVARLTATRAA